MANEKHTALRRSFLQTMSVGAAALAVPVGAVAAGDVAAKFRAGTWSEAVRSWPAAVETMKVQTDAIVEQFRPAYLAEVERLAEELRPRLEAGDLRRALACADEEDEQEARDALEDLCAERFGIKVDRSDPYNLVGDETLGRMICAVSPSAPQWDVDGDWNHICFAAESCAGSDVLAVARRQGWEVRS